MYTAIAVHECERPSINFENVALGGVTHRGWQWRFNIEQLTSESSSLIGDAGIHILLPVRPALSVGVLRESNKSHQAMHQGLDGFVWHSAQTSKEAKRLIRGQELEQTAELEAVANPGLPLRSKSTYNIPAEVSE